MAHLGDFALGTTVYAKFCTVTTTGAPTQLAGTPAVSIYENDDNTQITAGVTLTVDEDGVTGLNQLAIVASSGNGYEVGKFYDAVITTGTVGGTSVVGYVVASFTIEATAALRPTTAGRTLAVDASNKAPATIAAGDLAANSVTASALATDAVAEIADGVWDEALSGHVTAGTAGQRIAIVRANTAQAGGATSITLDASASAVDDFYNDNLLFITGGTGVGQARVISDYNGTTKVATVATWATNPSSDSVFCIVPGGGTTISGTVDANVISISGDTTAADNAEAFFDGTGYAGTNNVIPTVTTVTTATAVTTVNGLAANVITATAIANDAITAAKIATGAIDADAIADNAIDAGAIAANAITAAKIADGAIDAATFAAGAIDAAALAADAGTEIAAAVLAAAEADPIHANIEEINATAIQGNGTAGSKWGPV